MLKRPDGSLERVTAPWLVPELAGLPVLARTAAAAFEDGPTASTIGAAGRHDLVICGAVTKVAVLLASFCTCPSMPAGA